jgi:hypothetical protein
MQFFPILHRIANYELLTQLNPLHATAHKSRSLISGHKSYAFWRARNLSVRWQIRHPGLMWPVVVEQVSVLEMDGQFDKLDELIYVESHLSNISTKFYGEITQQMLKHADFPGSNNGTGLFQTICGLKIRNVYERILAGGSTVLEGSKV